MKKTLLASAIVLAMAGTASAGGAPNTIGVGAEFQLSGIGGLSANYDAGQFHVGGFLGFFDPAGDNNTTVDIGGRFFWHIASSASADFSLGGSLGIQNAHAAGSGDSITNLFIEPSFQIRAFITPNVALSFTGGFEVGAADADEVNITGQAVVEGGVHYYFF